MLKITRDAEFDIDDIDLSKSYIKKIQEQNLTIINKILNLPKKVSISNTNQTHKIYL